MGIDELAPSNTKKAKENAIVVAVLDKFGMRLAFQGGCRGKPLARHSVMQYFRQAKNWLLDQYPQHRSAVESRLLKMGRALEKYCMKRESGGFINKAPACTKSDLKQMLVCLYANATSSTDYQDAVLLRLLWYLFGRASDVTLVRKQNLSISAGDVFFVRFIRMKTSEEQRLSLFPDEDSATCPLLALALALMTPAAPCAASINQLPEQHKPAAPCVMPAAPLTDLLDLPEAATTNAISDVSEQAQANVPGSIPGIRSYVSRLLDRISKPAGVEEHLTSHSFRRGGAQHANASSALSAQWIFDRGAWNMTTTSKAFAYVFNTPSEDHKVAKVLSGLQANDLVPLTSLQPFDEQTQDKIKQVIAQIFIACYKLDEMQYNINPRVLEVMMAYLIHHYPSAKQLNPDGPAVKRLEECVTASGISLSELLSWSSQLTCGKEVQATNANQDNKKQHRIEEHPIFRQQAVLIDQLVKMNKRLDDRVNTMETKLYNKQQEDTVETEARDKHDVGPPPTKRRKVSGVTYLRDTWFAWYAQEPHLWSTNATHSKQKKSNAKMLVAYMKLFVDEAGFKLDERLERYRDDVVEVGQAAEKNLLAFLRAHHISSRGSNAVIKHMRLLHKSGQLNEKILRYRQLADAGAIVDPAPAHTKDTFE